MSSGVDGEEWGVTEDVFFRENNDRLLAENNSLELS